MISVCKPWMPGNERKYVLNAIDTNWISSSGEYITRFEEGFAKFCGAKYGVSCSSGLGALHLACSALGLKKGDNSIKNCIVHKIQFQLILEHYFP